ncbi:MAG TPA: hypothetical protein VE996_00940 [Terriglobales bacterium]|nr:hypothetical protein [Terriglobales bacterium]
MLLACSGRGLTAAMNGAVGPAAKMETTQQRKPRRTEFNRFQTFTLGPFVPTITNAHFDPYEEGLPRPGLSRREMETVERVRLPITPGRN